MQTWKFSLEPSETNWEIESSEVQTKYGISKKKEQKWSRQSFNNLIFSFKKKDFSADERLHTLGRPMFSLSSFQFPHSVILGTDPHLANHNPAIFSVPPGTEKLN